MENKSLMINKTNNYKAINKFFKQFDGKEGGFQICNLCYLKDNLIICYICKQYYHIECENLKEIPLITYICRNCDTILKNSNKVKEERKSIFDAKLQQTLTKKLMKKTNDVNFNTSKSEEKVDMEDSFQAEATYNSNSKLNGKVFGNHKRIIKHRRKRISNFEDEVKTTDKPTNILFSLDHTNLNYKKRKIKVGDNYNIDIQEFYQKIHKNISQDISQYERNNMRKVWSCNKLSNSEIEEYLNTCKLFWNYRNFLLESETCVEFYKMLKVFKRERIRLNNNQKNVIGLKVRNLKDFLNYGVSLNNHFEEMCLKILNICKYSIKKAVFFIYKNINPFIEEEEISFKSDIHFFQREILSIFSDEDSDFSV